MAAPAHARAARAGRCGRALIGPRRGARHTGAVDAPNLFTMLSAYRPGGGSSPFEDYCANGLAYLLATGREPLGALFAGAAGAPGARVADASVRPVTGGAAIADLALTFADGRRALVEVAVAPETPPERPPAPRDERGRAPAALSVAPDAAGDGAVGWRAIADALADARTGDLVLIAGKGAEPALIFADRVEPWDDAAAAREELGRLLGT